MSNDSIRDVVRCNGHTKTGARCKRRTAKTKFCFTHLKSELHLQVKKSNIPAAGLGLFTTVPRHYDRKRHRGEVIAPYDGEIVESHNPNYGNDYALQIKRHPPTFIDARKTTNTGRWANNAHGGGQNNSNLKPDNRHQSAQIRAARNIPAGGEVLTAYGRDYWRNRPGPE